MKILNLFLNYSCNARCGFCFNPAEPSQAQWRGMTTQRAAAALLQGYRDGCRAVSFIGGEATVRPDFLKLTALARRVGYEERRLVTNGIKLAERGYAEALVRAGLSRVDLSLHSHRPELHDRLLGVPGSFQKAMEALRHLKPHAVRLGLNVVITRLNYRGLPGLARTFAGAHGIREFSFFSLRYIGHMGLPAHAATLGVRMSEAAPWLRRAVEWLRGLGGSAQVCLGDLVPCALPGYEGLMTDWEAGANPDRLVHPDGRVEDSEPVCSQGKRQVAACRRCRFQSRCLGVNETYLAIFGEREFSPLPPVEALS